MTTPTAHTTRSTLRPRSAKRVAGVPARRGSVLLMVTVVLVLLALMGTVYLQIAQVDRLASRETADGFIDIVVDSVVQEVRKQLEDDLFDDTGKLFNPDAAAAGAADEPYDYPWTNPAVTRNVKKFDGTTLNAIGGKFDDAWLASAWMNFSSDAAKPRWPKITNLTGLYVRIPESASANATPSSGTGGEEAIDQSSYLKTDASVTGNPLKATGDTQSMDYDDGTPNGWEPFGVDADGDGVRDSRWEWAPLKQIGATAYVMACRIIDAGAMINLNAATAATRDGVGATDADYSHSSSPRNAAGFTPCDADLSRLLQARSASATATDPVSDWRGELRASFTYRDVDDASAPGGAGQNSATPLGLAAIDPFSVTAKSRLGTWYNHTKFFGENGAVAKKYDIGDELELRYGFGLNSIGRTTTAEGHLAQLVRRDGTGKDNTYEQDYKSVAHKHLNAAPASDALAMRMWMEGSNSTTSSLAAVSTRTKWIDIRKFLTTYNGAAIFAANHANIHAGTRKLKYDVVAEDGGADASHPLNNTTRVQNIFARLQPIFSLGNTATNRYMGTVSGSNPQDIAAEFAACIQDWTDKNNTPTGVALPGAGGNAYGLEALPMLREVYAQVAYNDEDRWFDVAGTKTAGTNMDNRADTWVAQPGSRAMIVEIGNPFDRKIPAASLNGKIRVRVMSWQPGVAYTQASVYTLSGVGADLDSRGKIVIISNPSTPGQEPSGTPKANLATDLSLSTAGAQVLTGAGQLLFNTDGQNIAVELQVEVAASTFVTYDRLYVPGLGFPNEFDHYGDPVAGGSTQSAAGVPELRHGQGSIGRDGQGIRYISNRGKALVGLRADTFANPGASAGYINTPQKINQDNKGLAGDVTLDKFQLPHANRRMFSVSDLALVPMFGFTDGTTDANSDSVPESDFPARFAGHSGNGVAEGGLDPRRRFLSISAPSTEVPDVTGGQGIPHAAMVLDQFTTLSVHLDTQDDDNDDGDFDGTASGRATSADNAQEQFIAGRMNLNTMPLHTAVQACPLPEPIADLQKLFEKVAEYRDTPANRATLTTLTAAANLRTNPGIASIGELLFIVPTTTDVNTNLQRRAFGDINDNGKYVDIFPLPADNLTAPNGQDTAVDDQEERLHRFQFLPQVFDVRSDVFILYAVVRGYPVRDFRTGPVESARFIAILDRGTLTSTAGDVRVLGLMRVN